MDKILLFIPMYNCQKQITRVLKQIDRDVQKYITEVIIVNNRSTDNGEECVKNYINDNPFDIKVTLLRNNENYGLGGSHKVAFKYAIENKFDYVIIMHGDDQGSIKDILPILDNKDYRNYDCMLGARFMKDSKLPGYSRFRTFGNRVYNLLFTIGIGKKVYDLGSGLNMYSTKMLESKYYTKFPDNLVFNYCMVFAIKSYKQKVKFFPITWREEDQVSNVKMFSQAIKVLRLLTSYVFANKRFMESEHRGKIIEDYSAEVVFKNY